MGRKSATLYEISPGQGCHKQKTSFLLLAVFFVSNTFFKLTVFLFRSSLLVLRSDYVPNKKQLFLQWFLVFFITGCFFGFSTFYIYQFLFLPTLNSALPLLPHYPNKPTLTALHPPHTSLDPMHPLTQISFYAPPPSLLYFPTLEIMSPSRSFGDI